MQLEGALTFTTVPSLLRTADSFAQAGTLDLSKVTESDSAGVSFLLELTRRAQLRGQSLRYTGIPVQLRGLLSFFEVDCALNLES